MDVISFNYKNSTLRERERALAELKGRSGSLLATCNRVELYEMSDVLCPVSSARAVRHLFRVAAGLESQVLGETEILGQVRAAALKAQGTALEAVFRKAVAVGARVRQETGISRGNVSVASVAVAKAAALLGATDKKVFLIGRGKVNQAAWKNLVKRGFKKTDLLAEADLVISATSAPHLVLRTKDIGQRTKDLLIIDLAVPRDVEPAIARLSKVTLFNIDDIKEEISLNLLNRQLEAIKAEAIIEQEVKQFCAKSELAAETVSLR